MTELSPCMVGNPSFGSVAIYERPGVLQPPSEEGLLPRFIIPEAPFVQAALAHAGERARSAMADDPAIVGATAFGSTVKGYAREMTGEGKTGSDVDINIFIDAETLGIPLRPDATGDDLVLTTWYPFELANHGRGTEKSYRHYIQEVLFPKDKNVELPVSPADIPISRGLLELSADREIEMAQIDARYRTLQRTTRPTWIYKLADWSEVPIDRESLEAIPDLKAAILSHKELPNHVDILTVASFLGKVARLEGTELAWMRPTMISTQRTGPAVPLRLFGLALTPGLAPFRRVFLDRISEAKEPDMVWRFFCKRLAKFENSPKNPRDIKLVSYPRTLAEAAELYR